MKFWISNFQVNPCLMSSKKPGTARLFTCLAPLRGFFIAGIFKQKLIIIATVKS